MKCIHLTLSALNIIFTRIVFIAHAFLVLWRTTDAVHPAFWLLIIILTLYIVDLYWVLFRRKTKEWHWFSISLFLYLLVVMPCFWVLRLQQLSESRELLRRENCTSETTSDVSNEIVMIRPECNITTAQQQSIDNLVELEAIKGITIPVRLDADTWIEALEQSMIFILIITRWIAPFYRASHRKLSESLFIYLGIGSDIIELFVLYEERYVLENEVLCYVVLCVWSLSICQFLLPLTGALAPSKKREDGAGNCRKCLNSEVITILAIVCMQDGPFLGIRLYVLIVGRVLTYTLIFFACKNILLVLLQIYRLIVVCYCVDPETGKSIRRKRNDLELGDTGTNRKRAGNKEPNKNGTMAENGKNTPKRGSLEETESQHNEVNENSIKVVIDDPTKTDDSKGEDGGVDNPAFY